MRSIPIPAARALQIPVEISLPDRVEVHNTQTGYVRKAAHCARTRQPLPTLHILTRYGLAGELLKPAQAVEDIQSCRYRQSTLRLRGRLRNVMRNSVGEGDFATGQLLADLPNPQYVLSSRSNDRGNHQLLPQSFRQQGRLQRNGRTRQFITKTKKMAMPARHQRMPPNGAQGEFDAQMYRKGMKITVSDRKEKNSSSKRDDMS